MHNYSTIMPDNNIKIRKFLGNKIKFAIERKVVEAEDEAVRDYYYGLIRSELNISNQLTMMINNVVQPTLEQLVVIAQILEVEINDLIRLKK